MGNGIAISTHTGTSVNTYPLWRNLTLLNFVFAALLGFTLRLAFVVELPWLKFMNFMHAHSKVAMLGWAYQGIFLILLKRFVQEDKPSGLYAWIFWISQLAVFGMLLSFPFQGYGTVSITFSSIHMLLSYLFVWQIWRHLPAWDTQSGKMIKAAFIFLVLSTVGVWALAPIIAFIGRNTVWYYMAVQFFLHFQFNGLFIFVMAGIFFHYLEKNGIEIPEGRFKLFYWLLIAATLLTYALAVSWAEPLPIVFWTNSIGATIQFVALIAFWWMLWPVKKEILASMSGVFKFLILFSVIAFSLKILVQTGVAIPYIAEISYTIRNYVIGFIHLMTLGMITTFIIGMWNKWGLMNISTAIGKAGLYLLLAGIVGSELLLFVQGSMLWAAMGFMPAYDLSLMLISGLMPLGLLLILGNGIKNQLKFAKE